MANLSKKADRQLASATRLVGICSSAALPIIGPCVAEILSQLVESRDEDRLIEQLDRLEIHIRQLTDDIERTRSKMSSPDSLALLETAFKTISEETEPEVRSKISALIANGYAKKDTDIFWIRKLLKILDRLIFPEIAWLEYFATCENYLYSNDIERKTQLQDAMDDYVTRFSTVHLVSPPKSSALDLQVIQRSFANNLIKEGLVEIHGNDHRIENYYLTHLGKIFVDFIWVPDRLSNLRKHESEFI